MNDFTISLRDKNFNSMNKTIRPEHQSLQMFLAKRALEREQIRDLRTLLNL
jgi:hypothetical protein